MAGVTFAAGDCSPAAATEAAGTRISLVTYIIRIAVSFLAGGRTEPEPSIDDPETTRTASPGDERNQQ